MVSDPIINNFNRKTKPWKKGKAKSLRNRASKQQGACRTTEARKKQEGAASEIWNINNTNQTNINNNLIIINKQINFNILFFGWIFLLFDSKVILSLKIVSPSNFFLGPIYADIISLPISKLV